MRQRRVRSAGAALCPAGRRSPDERRPTRARCSFVPLSPHRCLASISDVSLNGSTNGSSSFPAESVALGNRGVSCCEAGVFACRCAGVTRERGIGLYGLHIHTENKKWNRYLKQNTCLKCNVEQVNFKISCSVADGAASLSARITFCGRVDVTASGPPSAHRSGRQEAEGARGVASGCIF